MCQCQKRSRKEDHDPQHGRPTHGWPNMLTALDTDGTRITPRPGTIATCPNCTRKVQSKCGAIVAWHWAHISTEDCDTWSEPDTEWHRTWQAIVPIERREIIMGNHRADVIALDGTIIELQHSHLAPHDIRAREDHYGRMVWLFDARDAFATDRLSFRKGGPNGYRTFRWKHPRKSIATCRRPVILDIGHNALLIVKKIHPLAPCGGWGLVRPHSFITGFVNDATRPPHHRPAAA